MKNGIEENANILLSCDFTVKHEILHMVKEHYLVYILSGSIELMMLGNKKTILKAGEVTLLKRNQIVKAIKHPNEHNGYFKAVTIFLTQDILRSYCLQNNIESYEPYQGEKIISLKNNEFLKAYFSSLLPYFDEPKRLNESLLKLKTIEAIELLSNLKQEDLLFDFNEPHKIDLEKFMIENFRFNAPIQGFASLTGRSLSTFKRDFKKIFNITPQRWLTLKRLEEAHYLITKQGKKPSEIYFELGFENFSHFSRVYNEKYR